MLVADGGEPTNYLTSTLTGLLGGLAAVGGSLDRDAAGRVVALIGGAIVAVALECAAAGWGFVIPALCLLVAVAALRRHLP